MILVWLDARSNADAQSLSAVESYKSSGVFGLKGKHRSECPARSIDVLILPRRLFGPPSTTILFLVVSFLGWPAFAQNASDSPDRIRGAVINSVTREPIPRALVMSPDKRFATMTDSEGHFEFVFPQAASRESSNPSESSEAVDASVVSDADLGQIRHLVRVGDGSRPQVLMAQKPGFLSETDNAERNLWEIPAGNDVTILLIPEGVIAGIVALPKSESPDPIQVELFHWQVMDGRGRWVSVGRSTSKSDGSFRFAELRAGAYKLLTRELLDRDFSELIPGGKLFGYPPAYYSNAPDFASATTIELAAGEIAQPRISLVQHAYYSVKIPLANLALGAGVGINVYPQGNRGPGYTLGYNAQSQTIEGLLPNGTYTVEGRTGAPAPASGVTTLTVKDGPAQGPPLTLVPDSGITVMVKEEFTAQKHDISMTWSSGDRTFNVKGPRRYLNLVLESADDFAIEAPVSLREPTRSGAEALVTDPVAPGRYWVRVNSSIGYVASVRFGNTDLQHQPLTVTAGSSAPPIEITMRDDTAQIDGTIEGMSSSAGTTGSSESVALAQAKFLGMPRSGPRVYCVPTPDSSGLPTEAMVTADGNFVSPPLSPGTYRLLAFDHPQPALEYRNPEAMRVYDTKGPVVRLSGGQKEHVRLQLISTNP